MNAPASFSATRTGSAVLDDIVEVIGWDATMKLVRAIGGTRFHVPVEFEPGHRVVQAIGEKTARKLCESFHGTPLSIPIKLRREMHVRELAAIVPRPRAYEIADQVGISERMVFHILAQPVGASIRRGLPDPNQPGLFDHKD